MKKLEYLKNLKNSVIEYRSDLNLPEDVSFSIDMEYEGAINDNLKNHIEEIKQYDSKYSEWNVLEERYIEFEFAGQKHGGKIKSPILKDDIDSWNNLKITMDLLNKCNAKVTNICNAKINIDSDIFEGKKEYFRNFLLLWTLYEKEIYKFSSGDFNKLRKIKDLGIDRTVPYLKHNLRYIVNGCNSQEHLSIYLYYCSTFLVDKIHDLYLDVASYPTLLKNNIIEFRKSNNVIEFRVPNGSLEKEIWQNNINFFTKFLFTCKKDLDIDKIVYDIKHKKHNLFDLANLVFEDELDKENFLIQSLKTNKIYNKKLDKHLSWIDLNE